MFKVELEFDKTLPEETINSMCDQVDEIFAREGIPCAESSFGKRKYEDIVDKVTLGSVGILLHRIKQNTNVSKALSKAIGIFENETADLLTDYIRG